MYHKNSKIDLYCSEKHKYNCGWSFTLEKSQFNANSDGVRDYELEEEQRDEEAEYNYHDHL